MKAGKRVAIAMPCQGTVTWDSLIQSRTIDFDFIFQGPAVSHDQLSGTKCKTKIQYNISG